MTRAEENAQKGVAETFIDGRTFPTKTAAAAAAGLSTQALYQRKRRGYWPYSDQYPPHTNTDTGGDKKEREKRILAIRQELVICRLERLLRPENAAAAMVVIGRCKQMMEV